ncbi:MAG: phoR [Bacillales bacterium]|jgi:two-component system phosphate regulon sensor histidine kinase PhoR|nr:phoR [Bacillales bacterium]
MLKLQLRLLFSLIVLIMGVLITLGVLLNLLTRQFYEETYNDRILKETAIVANIVQNKDLNDHGTRVELRKLARLLKARITVIDADYKFIIDTKKNADESIEEFKDIINLVNKKKVWSHIVDKDKEVMKYAYPIKSLDTIDRYVLISIEFDPFESINKQIWLLLSACLTVALILIYLIGDRVISKYFKPIDAAANVAIELANGNYKARTYEYRMNETSNLSASINTLASNLENITKENQIQNERLSTLIDNMGSGLVLIDERGYIRLVNKSIEKLLKVEREELLDNLYYKVINYRPILSLIEEIFITEVHVKRQIKIELNNLKRYFQIKAAPISNMNNEWKGIVLVFHDITELKNLEQMRKDFVANVSHELRTPITSIKGFTETILDGAIEDRELTKKFLHIIDKESHRMETLINDLLDLSQIERVDFKLNVEKVNLSEVIQEIITLLLAKAESRNVNIIYEFDDKPIIQGDEHRLKQVLINLISNAISYNKEQGDVKIKLTSNDQDAIITIQDTGIGIDKAELNRIFERFYRVDKDRSRVTGGTGLGLAIVKHLMEAHQGELEVDSELGVGTTFTLKFKLIV